MISFCMFSNHPPSINKYNLSISPFFFLFLLDSNAIDWDTLVNERPTRYHTTVNELSPGIYLKLSRIIKKEHIFLLNFIVNQRQTDNSKSSQQNSNNVNPANTLSEVNKDTTTNDDWGIDTANSRVQQLQASIDDKQQRNDVIFLGNIYLFYSI